MSEGSYCQHKALKPADFKLNGTVLWWPEETNQLSQCGQSAVAQAGMPPVSFCTRSQTHPPAHTLLHSTQSLQIQYVLVPACTGWGQFRESWPWNKMRTKKNPIGTKEGSNLNPWSHSFDLLHVKEGGVHCSHQINWVFAVPCNSCQHCVAICKGKAKNIVCAFTYVLRLRESSGSGANSVLTPGIVGFLVLFSPAFLI